MRVVLELPEAAGTAAAAAGAASAAAVDAPNGPPRRRVLEVHRIVLGTGSPPNCLALPLVEALHRTWPVDVVCGLPVIGQDLRWRPHVPLYVVGSLAALRIGPDAQNLMGARKAAEIVAQNLGVYNELEDAGGKQNVFTNSFAALLDDSDSDDDSGSDSSSSEGDPANG